LKYKQDKVLDNIMSPSDGDRVQSPKRCVLKYKQDKVLDNTTSTSDGDRIRSPKRCVLKYKQDGILDNTTSTPDGDRIQSPKRFVLKSKQDGVLEKDKAMDIVQNNIYAVKLVLQIKEIILLSLGVTDYGILLNSHAVNLIIKL
jgi:hypothetical protein